MDAEKLAKMKAAAGVRIGEFSASKAQRARLEEVEQMCETGEGQRHRVASVSRSSRVEGLERVQCRGGRKQHTEMKDSGVVFSIAEQ